MEDNGHATERWAQVEGFPDYLISSSARIYNRKRRCFVTPYLNSYKSNERYLRVGLYRDTPHGKERRYFYIHRLVGLHFKPGYSSERWQIDHLIGPFNNAAHEIEWVTPQENLRRRDKGFRQSISDAASAAPF